MAKPTTKKEGQPMVRHMFSKERMQINNGPARGDVERSPVMFYPQWKRASKE